MKKQFYLFTTLTTLAALTGGLLATGCSRPQARQTPPPPTVTVAAVQQKEIVEWSEFTGRTEPVESVEIRPRTSGYIQEVRFQSGQLVKKGDVLFVIDPRWNQAVFDQRQAEYEQAKDENDRTAKLLANNAIGRCGGAPRARRGRQGRAGFGAARFGIHGGALAD